MVWFDRLIINDIAIVMMAYNVKIMLHNLLHLANGIEQPAKEKLKIMR